MATAFVVLILFFFTVSRASQINTRAPHKLVVGADFLFCSIGRLRSGGGCKLDHIITKERIRGSFALDLHAMEKCCLLLLGRQLQTTFTKFGWYLVFCLWCVCLEQKHKLFRGHLLNVQFQA